MVLAMGLLINFGANAGGMPGSWACTLGSEPVPFGCSVWASQYGSSGSSSGYLAANPIGCPSISGPSPTCYKTLYCTDKSGLIDQCSRTDQTGASSSTQSSDATCLASGFNHVVQAGQDKCVKKVPIR
jgi:hypothetical protein